MSLHLNATVPTNLSQNSKKVNSIHNNYDINTRIIENEIEKCANFEKNRRVTGVDK